MAEKPVAMLYEPDPTKRYRVQAKALRLVRREPRAWSIVGHTHDGRAAESEISSTGTLARPHYPPSGGPR